MKTFLLATLSFFTIGASRWRQETASTKPGVAALLAKFHSTTESERTDAFEQLRSNPANLQSPKVRKALLELLERESHELDSQLLEAQKKGYPDEGDNGGFAEYYSDLLGTVDSFADWNDPRQACILVDANPSDDSDFAAKIAVHAKVAVPCLLKRSQSAISMNRAVTVPVLVQILGKAKASLDPTTAQAARQIVLRALQDPDEAVRVFTVNALGRYGTEDMIPALRKVAEEDPAPGEEGRSIRTSAAEAIAAIEKRSRKGRGAGSQPQN
jgi:HEAT repeats